MLRIAINGLGRIGKSFLRTLMQDEYAKRHIDVVAINIGSSPWQHANIFFKYDTIMREYPGKVEQEDDQLIIDNKNILLLTQPDAKKLDWKKLAIDWVVDCSGEYTDAQKAQEHINAGADKVLISAPAEGEDISIVPGVNDEMYNPKRHNIVSLGSCTTNALMPTLQVLFKDCNLESAIVHTVHAYTNSQALLDINGKDPRRSRAAALNIVPTTTGASDMVAKIIPDLHGKVLTSAVRVPVGNVSFLQITFMAPRMFIPDEINTIFRKYAQNQLKNILNLCEDPLVSSDYIGNPHSIVIDGWLTRTLGRQSIVAGWYDNEWGYSQRLKDFLLKSGSK